MGHSTVSAMPLGRFVRDRIDVPFSEAVARHQFPPAIDRGLPLLTRAADHSKLWMVIAAALLATQRRRPRRAAARGLASLAVTSLVVNQVGKRIVPRERPVRTYLPIGRLAHRIPRSSSFPSGHAASAAAFAVGAAIECPPLAVPLGTLAAAVGFSRIYTGVHYLSDVVAGAAVGATIAGVGRRLVPAEHPPRRTGGEPEVTQPARPTGKGVVVVYNPAAGQGVIRSFRHAMQRELPDAEIIELRKGEEARDVFRDIARRADVLGVVGGDGTVNAATTVAAETGLPLVVIAGGTFNHFAKDLGLPRVDDSIAAVQAGHAVRIDVGDINGQLFVNTSSLGSYPDFVEVRERWERRLGKPIAGAIAIVTVLRTCPPLAVSMDGEARHLAMLFVGSNVYEPRNLAPHWRERLDTGRLDVRYVESRGGGTMARLVLAALSGRLERSARLVTVTPSELDVTMTEDPGDMSRDGEVSKAPQTARFTMRRNAVTVFRRAPA